MRIHLQITAVVFLLSCGVACAGPVLLASWDETAGHASAATGGVPNDPRVQIVLELSQGVSILGPRLGTGLFWEDGDHGTVDFTSATTGEFDAFATMATNGVDDAISQWLAFPWGGDGGGTAYESWRYGVSPDLIGNEIELVRLIVHDVSIEYPWIPPDYPDLEGIKVLAELTYEFYGTPIPEPCVAYLLISACPWLLRRRRYLHTG